MFNSFLLLLGVLTALTANAEWRDPTTPSHLSAMPMIGNANPPATFTLTAILITDNGKRAIINGATLKAGENLDDDSRLLKILPGHVIIRQHDSIKKLYLVPSVKKPLK